MREKKKQTKQGIPIREKQMKSFKEYNEDLAANNASSGQVAGLGDEPPVSKKAQKAMLSKNSKAGITAGRKTIAPVGMEGY